jgi:hypothetical protein
MKLLCRWIFQQPKQGRSALAYFGSDSKLQDNKRTQLDPLYQKIADVLDELSSRSWAEGRLKTRTKGPSSFAQRETLVDISADLQFAPSNRK